MNATFDQQALLKQLSKTYVVGELGLDLKAFTRTPDTAWVSFAARLLRTTPQSKRSRKAISGK